MLRAFSLLAIGFVGMSLAFAISAHGDEVDPITTTVTKTVIIKKVQKYQGWSAYKWATRTWYWKRRTFALKKTLLDDPQVVEAINLSCQIYGNCATLWRKARCESHLFPSAFNQSSAASGLFQFLPSTWSGTPFGYFNVFSPYANALAAGWMHTRGRGGEWVCR